MFFEVNYKNIYLITKSFININDLIPYFTLNILKQVTTTFTVYTITMITQNMAEFIECN